MAEQMSYEAIKLQKTKQKILNKLSEPNINTLEKMAMQFYLKDLQIKHPAADCQKFSKPEKGIGGTGDEQIRAMYVVRDHQTNLPLIRQGKLLIIPCVFSSFEKYLDIISSGRADSLRMYANRGAHPANPEDQKYVKPYEYAYAVEAVLKDREND